MMPSYLNALLPSPMAQRAFSSEHLIAQMIRVEIAYLDAMGGNGVAYQDFNPDMAAITAAMARDGVAIPELVAQMRGHHADPLLHKGMTSQDVMDTATALAIGEINTDFIKQIIKRLDQLARLTDQFGPNPLMGRTRMQAALEITTRNRLDTWANGLQTLLEDLQTLRPKIEILSLGGPVGDKRHWNDFDTVAQQVANRLGLGTQPFVWHSLRGAIMDYGNWLAKLTAHNAKIGQDIALMAQQGIDAVKMTSGGTSSAMAHKNNPVQAEILVTLGRYNAGLLANLNAAMIHEQERSGAAWTLEWITLPQMLTTAESSLINLDRTLGAITELGDPQ